jgi:hypothetical protein
MQSSKRDLEDVIGEAYAQVLRLGASDEAARDMALAAWRERFPGGDDYEARQTVARIIARYRLGQRPDDAVNNIADHAKTDARDDGGAPTADDFRTENPPEQT